MRRNAVKLYFVQWDSERGVSCKWFVNETNAGMFAIGKTRGDNPAMVGTERKSLEDARALLHMTNQQLVRGAK